MTDIRRRKLVQRIGAAGAFGLFVRLDEGVIP